MNRTVQTQISDGLSPEDILKALIAGVRIVDANHNPDKALRHLQKYLEAGAKELGIDPGVIGKMFREIREKKEKSGEREMNQQPVVNLNKAFRFWLSQQPPCCKLVLHNDRKNSTKNEVDQEIVDCLLRQFPQLVGFEKFDDARCRNNLRSYGTVPTEEFFMWVYDRRKKMGDFITDIGYYDFFFVVNEELKAIGLAELDGVKSISSFLQRSHGTHQAHVHPMGDHLGANSQDCKKITVGVIMDKKFHFYADEEIFNKLLNQSQLSVQIEPDYGLEADEVTSEKICLAGLVDEVLQALGFSIHDSYGPDGIHQTVETTASGNDTVICYSLVLCSPPDRHHCGCSDHGPWLDSVSKK